MTNLFIGQHIHHSSRPPPPSSAIHRPRFSRKGALLCLGDRRAALQLGVDSDPPDPSIDDHLRDRLLISFRADDLSVVARIGVDQQSFWLEHTLDSHLLVRVLFAHMFRNSSNLSPGLDRAAAQAFLLRCVGGPQKFQPVPAPRPWPAVASAGASGCTSLAASSAAGLARP